MIVKLNENLDKEDLSEVYDFLSIWIEDSYYISREEGFIELSQYAGIYDDVYRLHNMSLDELEDYINFNKLQDKFNMNFISNSLYDISQLQLELNINFIQCKEEIIDMIKEKILPHLNIEDIIIYLIENGEW